MDFLQVVIDQLLPLLHLRNHLLLHANATKLERSLLQEWLHSSDIQMLYQGFQKQPSSLERTILEVCLKLT